MDVHEKIRRLIGRAGETQTTLAQRFGVSQSTIHRWYSGTSEPGGLHRDMINGHYDAVFGSPGVEQPVLGEAEVTIFLRRIAGLTEDDVRFLVKSIKGSLIANGAAPLQTHPHGQPQPANLRREEEPSEPQPQR